LWESCIAIRDGPRKTQIWPFSFTRPHPEHRHSILKAIPGLEIATNTVTSATNISSLVTKIQQKLADHV